MKSVNAITLECMINPKIYNIATKQITSSDEDVNPSHQDLKFYRKRVISLTKDMFNNKICNTNMQTAFDLYVKDCIEYLKFQDTFDILQEDFSGIANTPTGETDPNMTEMVAQTTRKIFNNQENAKPLDKFVTISKSSDNPPPSPPLKKNIDLNDPKLKRKGLKSKDKNKDKK